MREEFDKFIIPVEIKSYQSIRWCSLHIDQDVPTVANLLKDVRWVTCWTVCLEIASNPLINKAGRLKYILVPD